MEIQLGAPVLSQDEENVGTVGRVIIDPRTNMLSHVVLAGKGSARDRAIPIWAIDGIEAGEMFLEVTAAEVERFPLYRPRAKAAPPSAQQHPPVPHEPGEYPALFPEDGSLPPVAVALAAEVAVQCHEVVAGRLIGIVADDYTAEAVTLIVRLDQPPGKQVAVPMAWARSLTRRHVVLECSANDLQTLPEAVLDQSAPGGI